MCVSSDPTRWNNPADLSEEDRSRILSALYYGLPFNEREEATKLIRLLVDCIVFHVDSVEVGVLKAWRGDYRAINQLLAGYHKLKGLPPIDDIERVRTDIKRVHTLISGVPRDHQAGRPKGSTTIPDEEFPDRLEQAYIEAQWAAEALDEPVTKAGVAGALGISKKTLDRAIVRLNLQYPPD